MSVLGERIRSARKELGLTQAQLAGTELSKSFISLIEKGRAKPSIETLTLLSARLQKPVRYFLEPDTPMNRRAIRIMLASAWVGLKRGEFTQAAEMFEQARQTAAGHSEAVEAECFIGMGSALAGLRQLDLARESVQRGKAMAEAIGDPQLLVRVSHVLGLIEYYGRNFPTARRHFLEGYQLLCEVGHSDLSLAGHCLLCIGNTYEEVGEYDEATHWYKEALSALEPTEDLVRIGQIHVRLGVTYRESGRHSIALTELNRAEHIFEVLNSRRLLAQARNSIGITLLDQGKADEALVQLRSSLSLKEKVGDDEGRARTLTEIGRALIAKRAFEDAEQALADAEGIAKKVRDVAEGGRITLMRARLYREMGRLSEAVRYYKEAINSFDRHAMRYYLGIACNELGDLLIRQKRRSEAAPYLARALRSLTPSRGPRTTEDV